MTCLPLSIRLCEPAICPRAELRKSCNIDARASAHMRMHTSAAWKASECPGYVARFYENRNAAGRPTRGGHGATRDFRQLQTVDGGAFPLAPRARRTSVFIRHSRSVSLTEPRPSRVFEDYATPVVATLAARNAIAELDGLKQGSRGTEIHGNCTLPCRLCTNDVSTIFGDRPVDNFGAVIVFEA
jgi:hypothetical protein